MKCSGTMCFKMILKVTKNQGSTLSIEDAFFKKQQGGGFNLTPPPIPDRLGLIHVNCCVVVVAYPRFCV